jgi:DNA phosphorothioation-dependent restriction protein DptG
MPRASDDKDRLIARSLAIIIVLLKRLEDGDVSEPNDAENAMLDEWKEMMDTWKASYTTKEAV